MCNKRLIVALDVPSCKEAEKLVDQLNPLGVTFKVGLELFHKEGPRVLKMIHNKGGDIFLDAKFHDIPNTVKGAVKSATSNDIFMLTIHAAGGKEMMKAAVEAARKESEKKGLKPPKVLAVTVLTSINQTMLEREIGIKEKLEQRVVEWARQSKEIGLDGVVASPREIAPIRKAIGKDFLIVTPGIRPADTSHNDQERFMNPKDAITLGADYLVVGRPITKAENPALAAKLIIKDIKEALEKNE